MSRLTLTDEASRYLEAVRVSLDATYCLGAVISGDCPPEEYEYLFSSLGRVLSSLATRVAGEPVGS